MSKEAINIKSNGIRNEFYKHTHTMKKKIIILTGSILLTACGGIRPQLIKLKRSQFKEMTKDICVENPHEVYLAQVLYNEIFNK